MVLEQRTRSLIARNADRRIRRRLLPSLDADNRLLPGFVAEAVALARMRFLRGVVYGDRREFGARSGDITCRELDCADAHRQLHRRLCCRAPRSLSEAGGYDVDFTHGNWTSGLGAAARGWRFVRIPASDVRYRVRPDSMKPAVPAPYRLCPVLRRIYDKYPELISGRAVEILITAHVERRKLLDVAMALRVSRDGIQVEIDRLALGTREQIAALREIVDARDAELASVKFFCRRGMKNCPHSEICNPPKDLPCRSGTSRHSHRRPCFSRSSHATISLTLVCSRQSGRHNPNSRLQVVVLDDPDRCIFLGAGFRDHHADRASIRSAVRSLQRWRPTTTSRSWPRP